MNKFFKTIRWIIIFMGMFSFFAKPQATEITKQNNERLQMLEEMFNNMQFKYKWNIENELVWGYFFTDSDPEKLKPIAEYLSSQNYRTVDIYPTDDNLTYFLHVEKIEHHTVDSLYMREQELRQLAGKYGIESYDGMDVGPIMDVK